MVIICPQTALGEAALLAGKLCRNVQNHPFKGADGQELHVTTSIGVAAFQPGLTHPDALVEAADKALYRAKESGRNQVCLAE